MKAIVFALILAHGAPYTLKPWQVDPENPHRDCRENVPPLVGYHCDHPHELRDGKLYQIQSDRAACDKQQQKYNRCQNDRCRQAMKKTLHFFCVERLNNNSPNRR